MDEKSDVIECQEITDASENECSENFDEDENCQFKDVLVKRIQELWEVMGSLKEQLQEEKELWRKEIDELCKLQYEENLKKELSVDQSVLSSTEPLDSPGSPDKKNQQFLNETAMTVYEQHLVRYQDTFGSLSLHADKRQQIRRQLAAHSYKRKLMEVERMCNLELARVKQTASYLEPLNKIASEWNLPQSAKSNNTKFSSMRDLHYSESCTTGSPSVASPDTQSLPSVQSDVPAINSYMSQLPEPVCPDFLMQKAENEFASQSPVIIEDLNQTQSEMCNTFCNCEELPILMQNKIWTN